MTFASVSTILPWQNGHSVGRVTSPGSESRMLLSDSLSRFTNRELPGEPDAERFRSPVESAARCTEARETGNDPPR